MKVQYLQRLRAWGTDVSDMTDEQYVYRDGFYKLINTDSTEDKENATLQATHVPVNTNDYKPLYEECKRMPTELTENFQKHMIEVTTEYEFLKEKYGELEEDSQRDFEIMKTSYETAIEEKDKNTVNQMKTIKSYDERLCTLESESSKPEFERLIKDYEKAIKEKNEEIASQKEILKSCSKSCNHISRVSSEEYSN